MTHTNIPCIACQSFCADNNNLCINCEFKLVIMRHDLQCDTMTLCGIDVNDFPNIDISICCDCGHPECEYPITCPACIQVRDGKVN